MGIDAKEKTAHSASVGADAGQSIQKDSDNSIPASEVKGNGEMENLEEMYRKMQRMADPRYLHTLTMTELFQTSLNIFVQEYQCPRKSSSIGNICLGYIKLIPSQ